MTEPPDLQPMDEYNSILLKNVHPPDWQNPLPSGRYNLLVIGAGTAGLVTAAGAAGLGARVALVERHLFGGDCLNYGCVPSKSILRSAHALAQVNGAEKLGLKLTGPGRADFAAVMDRMRQVRSRISAHDAAEKFSKMGIDVFLGTARFTGPDTVEVEGTELRFARACIAAGSRPVCPPIEGLAEAGFLTNETVFSLTELPQRLAILGAGPVGCELAQAFARLGSQVTLIQQREQILPREDADAVEILTQSLQKDRITILTKAQTTRVSKSADEKQLHLTVDGQQRIIAVDEILVAAGRAPNVEDLNLEAAGVDYDARGGVLVDDRLRTSNRRVYAAGDICLPFKFTHTADAAARIVIQNALFWGRKKSRALTVPWCTYTDPEIAHVGMYAQQAESAGIEVDTFSESLVDVDRALADGQEQGFVKVHVKKGSDKIIGATIVARHAGEMISEITLAMLNKVGLGGLAKVIHPYPTQAEALKHLADSYNRTRLTPFLKKVLTKVMAWRR